MVKSWRLTYKVLDILTDFGDIDHYGANQVIEKTARLFAGSSCRMYDLFSNHYL
jgi:hypothetical protein